jgi:hypothetical protein
LLEEDVETTRCPSAIAKEEENVFKIKYALRSGVANGGHMARL